MRIGHSAFASRDPWAGVDEIRKVLPERERPAGSFTVAEYAERYSMDEHAARCQLSRFVRVNRLLKKSVLINSKVTSVYWIPVPVAAAVTKVSGHNVSLQEVPCQKVSRPSRTGTTGTRKGQIGD